MSINYLESNDKILSKSVKPETLALKAIFDVRKVQYAMQREQNKLLELNKKIYEQNYTDVTIDNLAKQIRINNANDLLAIEAFNNLIKPCIEIPFGVGYNYMAQILTEISSLPEEILINLTMGKSVQNFDNYITLGNLPVLGEGNFWGSSLSTFYSAALGIINMTLRGASIEKCIDLTKSAVAHSFKMPADFDPKLIQQNNYIYQNESGQIIFSVFHSGYSFGGSYNDPKQYAPQDCGTFVGRQYMARKLLPKATTSTADLLHAYSQYTDPGNPYLGKEEWSKCPSSEIVKLFDVNKSQSMIGSTYFYRRFNENAPEKTTVGTSGHTAIIIGKDTFGNFVTIGANRDMPKMEGYGLQTFSSSEPEVTGSQVYKRVHILDPTDKVLLQTEFKRFSEIEYKGLGDLREIVNYFDKELSLDNEGDSEGFSQD